MLFDMATQREAGERKDGEGRRCECRATHELHGTLTQEVDAQEEGLDVLPIHDLGIMMCHQEVDVIRQPTDREYENNDDHHLDDLCVCVCVCEQRL